MFCGGTEMTRQFHRFAREELLEGAEFVPTYGNTLMGLACHKPFDPADDYRSSTTPRSPGRCSQVVDPDRAGAAGRVRRAGPGEADDAHQGVLRAGFPGTRRGDPHAADSRSTRGTAWATCGRSASWKSTWSRESIDDPRADPPSRPALLQQGDS